MKTNHGFTLIELMIAIVILAIVLGIGVPSFRDLIQNNRISAVTNDLVTALQLARSEATKRRQNVVVCRRNDAGTGCSAGTAWAVGWLTHSGGTVIQVWDPPSGNPTVTASAASITFDSSGRVTAATDFDISLAGGGDAQRCVDVSATGRVSTTRATCP